jgi:hypothetical protein
MLIFQRFKFNFKFFIKKKNVKLIWIVEKSITHIL